MTYINSNIFEQIKKEVSYEDLCRKMDWKYIKRGNRLLIHSLHNNHDKNPSMVLYEGGGSKCFSTGIGCGDIISTYATAKGLSQIEAAQQLADMFGIIYEQNRQSKEEIRKAAEQTAKDKALLEAFRELEKQAFNEITDCFKHCREMIKNVEPLTDKWRKIHRIEQWTDYLSDILIFGKTSDKLKAIAEWRSANAKS